MKILFVLQIILLKEMEGLILLVLEELLTRSIVNYINQKIKNSSNISGDDAREGLTCVISVKLPRSKIFKSNKR